MADISQQDLQNLTDAINRLSGGSRMGGSNRAGYSSNSGSDDKAVSGKKKEFVKGMDNVVNAMSKSDKEFNNLYKSTKDVAGQTKELAANFKSMAAWIALVGTATTSAVNAVTASVDTYRDMANVGQTFTGSMLKMQMAAADAALPLADFAKLIKENGMAAAVIGTKGLSDMSKGLRTSLREFDLLNLTTQDLNDYLSEYTETQRLYGNLQNLNSAQATNSMKDLAIETTKLSQMTGKNRLDILKQSSQAMRDNSLMSLSVLNAGKNLDSFNGATQKALTYMSAMPGQAGNMLSGMLAQTVGRGSAELTDFSKQLIDGGLYGVNSIMNNLNEKIKSGTISDSDLEKSRSDLLKEFEQNMSAIKWQADTGNEAAKHIVETFTPLLNLKGKALEEFKRQEAITSTVMRLQDTFNNLSGFLRTKFFTAVEQIFKAFDNSKLKPQIEALGAKFGELMDRFGTFLTKVFSPENLLAMGTKITAFLDGVGTALPVFLDVVGSFSSAFTTVVKPIIDGFALVHEKFGLLGTAAAGLIAYLGVKGVGGLIGGFMARIKGGLSEKFKVGYGIENVGIQNGGLKVWVLNNGGGGGSGRNSRGRGRKPGPRSGGSRSRGGAANRPGRAGGIATEAPNKSGGFFRRAAKGVSSVAGKAGGLWGKLPTLAKGGALGIGASLALDALPDFAGKKVLSAGSNIAGMASTGAAIGSIVPGAGTLIGGLVGGGIGAIKEAYDNWDEITKTTSSIWDGAKNMVSGWFGPSVSAPSTPKTPEMPKPDNAVMSEREQQQMRDMLNKAMESNQSAMIDYLLKKNTSESTLLALQMMEELRKMNRTSKAIANNTE